MKTINGRVIFESEEDLLPIAMSVGTTGWNQTGSWKYLEPFYQDLTPPCVHACQAGNDIVTFMRLIDEGRYEEAALGILENNPFPATLGRVCPHPCEAPCSRKELGGTIAIQSAERFLGDYAIEHNILPVLPAADKQPVTIVGAGPAGVSAAYFLRRLGHPVTVLDAEQRSGGLLWSGIPPFRLPRQVLARELERFEKMGIQFRFGIRVGESISVEELLSQSPAVLLAVGLSRSRSLNIPGEDHPQVWDGLHLLKILHSGGIPEIGYRVAVIGGGNTALDCARSLVRLGHEVQIVYRRSQAEMPAFEDEIKEGLEEGIQFEFLTAPIRVHTENGQIRAIECIRMNLLEPDESGRRRPVPVQGSEFILNTDAVVKALGEILDEEILPASARNGGRILTTEYLTPIRGLFASGDCTGNGGTVAKALTMGREAAYAIHAHLVGEKYAAPDLLKLRDASSEIAKYEQFASVYFRRQKPPEEIVREAQERRTTFAEVRLGLSENEIRAEAARCFKCGTCTLCDNCRFFCPDNAIVLKPDRSGYRIRYEYCKGCMVCIEECPRAAIHQRKVEV